MSKRFGRNQKRKLKDMIEAQKRKIETLEHSLKHFPINRSEGCVEMQITKAIDSPIGYNPLTSVTIHIKTDDLFWYALRTASDIRVMKKNPDRYAENMGHMVADNFRKMLPDMLAEVPDDHL